jgi:hypothetical protein
LVINNYSHINKSLRRVDANSQTVQSLDAAAYVVSAPSCVNELAFNSNN